METISQWLKERCHQDHLSLRRAAAKTGLSHATIRDIINGGGVSPVTVRKLAETFGGNGELRLALEDKLLILAGYRSERPRGEELSESMAELIDKAKHLNDSQLKMMVRFADFLMEIDGRGSDGC